LKLANLILHLLVKTINNYLRIYYELPSKITSADECNFIFRVLYEAVFSFLVFNLLNSSTVVVHSFHNSGMSDNVVSKD